VSANRSSRPARRALLERRQRGRIRALSTDWQRERCFDAETGRQHRAGHPRCPESDPADFRALDYDAFIEVIGVYMYLLSCHKSANARLMHRDDGRRVLYLRGYDFEAAFATGGEVAAGIATWDTTAFTLKLRQLLGAGRGLVKVLSPKEVDRETVTIERWYDDFDAMIQWINRRRDRTEDIAACPPGGTRGPTG
jgi:hypothetical protein